MVIINSNDYYGSLLDNNAYSVQYRYRYRLLTADTNFKFKVLNPQSPILHDLIMFYKKNTPLRPVVSYNIMNIDIKLCKLAKK